MRSGEAGCQRPRPVVNDVIKTCTDALAADLTNLTTQQTSLTNYQTQLTSVYTAQFTALNTLMATMSSNSQYLTQLFGGANSAGALSGNKSRAERERGMQFVTHIDRIWELTMSIEQAAAVA